MMHTPEMYR